MRLGDDAQDHYEVLQVHPRAGSEVIKRAYRTLSRMYHPDANPPERRAWASDMMSRLNEAYRVLSDPKARREYDATRDADGPRRASSRSEGGGVAAAVRSCHWHAQRARVSICTVCGRSVCAECRHTDGMAVVCPSCEGKRRPIEVEVEEEGPSRKTRQHGARRSGIAAAFRELRNSDGLNQAAFAILLISIGALALGLWLRGFVLLVAFRFPGNLHLVWPLAIIASIGVMAAIGVVLTSTRVYRRSGVVTVGGCIMALAALASIHILISASHADEAESANVAGDHREAIRHYSFALWNHGHDRRNLRRSLGLAYLQAFKTSTRDSTVLATGTLTYLAEHSSPKELKAWMNDADPLLPVNLEADGLVAVYRAAETASEATSNDVIVWTRAASVFSRTNAGSVSEEIQADRDICLGLSLLRLSEAVRDMPGEAVRRADEAYINFIQRVVTGGREGNERARGPLEKFFGEQASYLLEQVDVEYASEQVKESLGSEITDAFAHPHTRRPRRATSSNQRPVTQETEPEASTPVREHEETEEAPADVEHGEAESAHEAPQIRAPFMGNCRSRVYHRTDCRQLSALANPVAIWSHEHAEAEDYQPCSQCQPDELREEAQGSGEDGPVD